jgi:hypothetical protein
MNNELAFIESIKPIDSYLRGDMLRKKIYELQTLEELWAFAISHNFSKEELLFYVERVRFVFNSKAKKEFFTDSVLKQTSQLFCFLLAIARGFDKIAIENKQVNPMMHEKSKKYLQLYINGINVLTELRANEVWDDAKLYEMFCISMDTNKLLGPIMRKLSRISLMAS